MPETEIYRPLWAILDVLGLTLESLFDDNNGQAGANRDKVVAWLYRILDTLDTKTGHLLRFAALLLAAQTFLAGVLVRGQTTTAGGSVPYPHSISIAVLLLLLLPLIAVVNALRVFDVSWPFFGFVRKKDKGHNIPEKIKQLLHWKVKEDSPGTPRQQIEKEIQNLAYVCDKRYDANRDSYFLCLVSAGAFLVTLVLAITFH